MLYENRFFIAFCRVVKTLTMKLSSRHIGNYMDGISFSWTRGRRSVGRVSKYSYAADSTSFGSFTRDDCWHGICWWWYVYYNQHKAYKTGLVKRSDCNITQTITFALDRRLGHGSLKLMTGTDLPGWQDCWNWSSTWYFTATLQTTSEERPTNPANMNFKEIFKWLFC